MKSFYEIGSHLSDKVNHHRYDRFYPLFLESLRDQEFNMLEIGVWGGGSLQLWEEYFPKAYIHGVDINYDSYEIICKSSLNKYVLNYNDLYLEYGNEDEVEVEVEDESESEVEVDIVVMVEEDIEIEV